MREQITRNEDLRSVAGEWGVWHRYTHGVAGEKFFRELQAGKLLASTCPKCHKTFLPASQYCEDCFLEMGDYKSISGTGKVASFTVLHQSLDEEPLPQPIIAAFVQFDGIEGGLLAPLKNASPAQVKIGMPVKPQIDPKHGTNTIADLSWVPV